MTREQIQRMARKTAELVASGRIGVCPPSRRQQVRFNALKAEHAPNPEIEPEHGLSAESRE